MGVGETGFVRSENRMKTLLIVEDDADIQDYYGSCSRAWGCGSVRGHGETGTGRRRCGETPT